MRIIYKFYLSILVKDVERDNKEIGERRKQKDKKEPINQSWTAIYKCD